MLKQLACATCLLPLIFGCGGDDEPATLELSDVCSADGGLFIELIDKTVECNSVFFEFFLPATPTANELEFICGEIFGDHIDDGTVLLGSRADAEACLAALASKSCDEFDIDLIPECRDLLVGTRETGEACDVDPQCVGDAYCDRGAGGDCGVCVDRRPDGASCDDDDECQGRNCSDSVCLTPGEVGAECARDEDCLGSLMCNQHLAQCQERGAWSASDACEPSTNDCWPFENGLYCDGDSQQCVAFLNIGDDCGPGLPLCNFLEGEHCDTGASDKCVGPSAVGEGQPCNLFIGAVCDEGLLCSGIINGVCIEPAAPGDECDPEAELACPGTLLLECVAGTCQYGRSQASCEL